jgi:hypothetical protein
MVDRRVRWVVCWFLAKPGGIDVLGLLWGCVVWDMLLTCKTPLCGETWSEELASGRRLLLLLYTKGAILVCKAISGAIVCLGLPCCVLATLPVMGRGEGRGSRRCMIYECICWEFPLAASSGWFCMGED